MPKTGPVAIVDYGLGNLFSVLHACRHVGMKAKLTSSRSEILDARAVILPGVGAFGDAMATLRRLDLVEALRDIAAEGTPFLGICLGLQLLMSESHEFGLHQGLGIIPGEVVRLQTSQTDGRTLKVPQVGWNAIQGGPWENTLLKGLTNGEAMYFVHSFYVKPAESEVVLSRTRYGPTEFCSSLGRGNLFACQFHPERSGPAGLRIYENLLSKLDALSPREESDVEQAHR